MKFVKTMKSREREIEEKDELREVLKDHPVKLAYLFGSYSRGEITKFSDIDIAVLFEPGAEKRVESLRMDLMELLGEEAVDLIDLDVAPLKLRYKILKEGEPLLGDDSLREFEIKSMLEYFDFKPLEDMYFESMKKRIESGKFGR